MDIIFPLITQVIILFVMMVPGYLLKKTGLVHEGFGKGISNLVLYIAQPSLIAYAYISYEGTSDIWWNALWVLILSLLAHGIFAVAALTFFRTAEDYTRRMLRLATVFSNAAFMGIPLVSVLLGAEATIYASIYNISFNLFLWTLGVYFCTARRDEDGDGTPDGEIKPKHPISPMKVILHPVMLAAAVGLLVLGLGVSSYIPPLVISCLEMLKNLVAPLSMVVIGLRMVGMTFRGAFRDKHLYLFLALRHLILPLSVLLVLWVLSICGLKLGETVNTVTLLLAATPAATSATMFAEKYDCDPVYTSRVVTISTIVSVVTMPLIIMLGSLCL